VEIRLPSCNAPLFAAPRVPISSGLGGRKTRFRSTSKHGARGSDGALVFPARLLNSLLEKTNSLLLLPGNSVANRWIYARFCASGAAERQGSGNSLPNFPACSEPSGIVVQRALVLPIGAARCLAFAKQSVAARVQWLISACGASRICHLIAIVSCL